MTGDREPHATRLPFRGPRSYGMEDRDLFFGRGAEARIVAAMVAAEPISVLTGASGTGKSSLLRAEVVPTLLGQGWCVIYAQPEDDPVEALKSEMMAQALPDAREERRVIELICRRRGDFGKDTRVSALVDWFRALDPGALARAEIIAPPADAKVPRSSFFARLLLELLSPAQFIVQLRDAAAYCSGGTCVEIDPDPTIGQLDSLLDYVASAREKLIGLLARDTLDEQVAALWAGWARGAGFEGIALFLDQAEELYTSFGAASVSPAPGSGTTAGKFPWAYRERLFTQLRAFAPLAQTKPLRFCFSLRPERYADLRQSLDVIAPDERQAVYFLRRFNQRQALDAVAGPATRLHGQIDRQALKSGLREIGTEGELGEIDPFLVGVVFDLAWRFARNDKEGDGRMAGRHLDIIRCGPPSAPDEPSTLAQGALRWLLESAFEGLDPGEEYDVLDLLRGLFSEEGMRRVAPEETLVCRPLRDTERLRVLLADLERAGLVRRFSREGVTYVDIRHERLIEPILARSRQAVEEDRAETGAGGAQGYRSFLNEAIAHVLSYSGADLDLRIARGLEDDPLPDWARESLQRNFTVVRWDPPAARLMLASLLHAGPARRSHGRAAGGDGGTDPAEMVDWDRWRAMVATLVPIAATRLSTAEVPRSELVPVLLRGGRLDRQSAQDWIERGGRRSRDLLLRLWLSKLTAPDENRDERSPG